MNNTRITWDKLWISVRNQSSDYVTGHIWQIVADQVMDRVAVQVTDEVWDKVWDQVYYQCAERVWEVKR